MPGFGGSKGDANPLSDHEIALLATYVRTEYGGTLPAVTDQDVAVVRQGGPSSPLIPLARLGLGLGAACVAVLAVLASVLLRRRHARHPLAAEKIRMSET